MDRIMLGAAKLFTASTVIGTIVSFHEDVPGEPFGHTIQWSVLDDPAGRLLGGSGLSAPWVMPAMCLAAATARPGQLWPRRMITGIGAALTIGQLIEPVTWGLRSRKPQVYGMVVLNLLSAAALFISARQRAH